MKEYNVVFFFFLFFNSSLSNGHTLSKIEVNNITVYEVSEDDSSLSITHPKDEKPTIREIVYYHIIEKPYTGSDKIDMKTTKLDNPVEYKRSFTNGHGFQYINENGEVIEEPKSDDDIEQLDILDNNTSELDDDDDSYKIENRITDATSTANYEATSDDINETTLDTNDKQIDNIDKSEPKPDDNDKKLDDAEELVDIQVRPGKNSIDNDKIDELDVNKKAGGSEAPSRRKREINYSNIPDAPTLPKFKLDTLPDYIKAILMNDPEFNTLEQADILEDEIDENVFQLEEAVKYNHPTSASKAGENKRKVRTYGMSLTGDSGVVWNDVSAPHIEYHVGEPEIITSTTSKPKEDTTVKSTTTTKIYESTKEPSKDSNKHKDEQTDSDEFKDIQASFDEIDKMLDQLIKDNEKDVTESITNVTTTTEKDTDTTTETTNVAIKTTTEYTNSKDTTSTQRPDEDKKHHTSTESTILEDKNKAKDSKDNAKEISQNENKDEDSKQKEFVKELMKNKYFWQWLQDSSTAYLGIVMKKLDILIKAEVEKQIKTYFEEHKNVSTSIPNKNNATQNIASEKPIQSNNVTDVVGNTTQNPNANNTELNITTTNTTVDEPSKNGNKTKNISREHNNKHSDSKNKENPVKIEATNMYGNSVGNDKVTNIFIFNIGKDTDLENLKPISNGTDGVFVFGLDDKKPDQDRDKNSDNNDTTAKPDTSTEKPEVVKDPVTDKPTDESTTSNTISETTESEHTTEATTPKPKNDESSTATTTKKAEETTTEAIKSSTDLNNQVTTTLKPDKDKESNDATTEASIESTTDLSKDSSSEIILDNDKKSTTTEKPEVLTTSTTEKAEEADNKENGTSKPNDDKELTTTEQVNEPTTEPTKTEDLSNKTKDSGKENPTEKTIDTSDSKTESTTTSSGSTESEKTKDIDKNKDTTESTEKDKTDTDKTKEKKDEDNEVKKE